jgi:hypothetical protein
MEPKYKTLGAAKRASKKRAAETDQTIMVGAYLVGGYDLFDGPDYKGLNYRLYRIVHSELAPGRIRAIENS